jgi:hypothetical protein
MRLANFTLDQLKVLPLRAIVAFAARCARRVEHLAQLPEGDTRRESRRTAVDAALRERLDIESSGCVSALAYSHAVPAPPPGVRWSGVRGAPAPVGCSFNNVRPSVRPAPTGRRVAPDGDRRAGGRGPRGRLHPGASTVADAAAQEHRSHRP